MAYNIGYIMALPTLEKTWQFNVNYLSTTSGVSLTDGQNAVFRIKQVLTGFASNPWTVVKSSNSVSAGAADYWTTAANLISGSGGVAHSWIVLQQAGITGGPSQLCLDFSTPNQLSTYFSPTVGFVTGGTTTNRPTASDEVALWSTGNTWATLPANIIVNVMQSSDGQSTRVFLFQSGICRMFIAVETLADSLLTYKGAAMGKELSLIVADMYANAKWNCKHSTFACTGYTATEVYNNTMVTSANSGNPSNITGSYPLAPLSVHSETTNCKGRLGRLVDMWFGSTTVPNGSTYPSSPDDKEFIQFGPLVLPWNGTTPIIT